MVSTGSGLEPLRRKRITEPSSKKESYETKPESPGTHITQITNYNITLASNETSKDDFAYDTSKFKGAVSYIEETEKARIIQKYLVELKDVLDNPRDFEQIIASIMSVLNDLELRKGRREVYFSDLILMIRQALMNSDFDTIAPEGINVIYESAGALAKELTNKDIKLCRTNFRKASLNILPKLKWDVDYEKIKELFNEIAD